MERIDELLDKYFRAETTLAEEIELKNYYSSGKIKDEHKLYISLFASFAEEKKVILTSEIKLPSVPQLHSKRSNLFSIGGISAVAASLIIGVMLLFPKEDTNYVMIKGKRFDQKEFVQKYAEKKLANVNRLLSHNLEPMKNLEIKSSRKAFKKVDKAQKIIENAYAISIKK